MKGFYLKPKNNFTELLHDPVFLGRGMGREIICLIQCSTYPNIAYIIMVAFARDSRLYSLS